VADAALVESIRRAIHSVTPAAWRARRTNVYLGQAQRFGALRPDWVTRLYRRPLHFSEPHVHELLLVEGPTGTLRGTLRHLPYRDLAHHLDKIDRYAAWGAADLHDGGRRAHWGDLSLRPAWRFVRSYLLRGGLLGGRTGLIASRMEAISVYRKYARLRHLDRR
jgi:hypothetical protein